ncbi:MAG: M20/M25/M40 family metallo-hydrolase [Bacteroidota bacterium]|nr:M20/M25/M40 family metallo-hydrolase [Bacteroidota bacterium]MDP4212496.1 M20/M25/M40 family metallo-hydrolase [Bacteroidota bacterium]MDP4248905.1 M20/M25/M40 family metallo-hydrolase [Bacteroidota bacterium]
MTRSFFLFLPFLFASLPHVHAQKLRKADRQMLTEIQTDIQYLSGNKLEGRRAGTPGEKLASDYIISSFEKTGLTPLGDQGSWLQGFEIYDGKDISRSRFSINNAALVLNRDYFPLDFSANQKVTGSPAVALQESGSPWFYDLKEIIESTQNNPHFDMEKALREKTKNFAAKGATAVIFYNSSKSDDGVEFNPAEGIAPEGIPVIYVTHAGRKKYLTDISQTLDVDIDINMEEKKRWGHNVIGYLDRGAPYTVVIGAHYDHLGYGEDGSSLYRGTEKMIHPGADDNASGTAALMELARMLHKTKSLKSNYLFIAFSGEESGLLGSKYFTLHPELDLSRISYMMNMDMIGRLNDSSHTLIIGGFGSSPQWASLISSTVNKKIFSIREDSSGVGPSDHTSFYLKNIPVLFFFTGIHPDYHRPTDEADKINYNGELQVVKLIYSMAEKMDGMNKPVFAKTRDAQYGETPAFNVTLGFMPDYSFNGNGVRIDVISTGRPAEKAGMQAGDVIIRLGKYPVKSLQTYMEALSKFNRDDKTTVEYNRGTEVKTADVQFN